MNVPGSASTSADRVPTSSIALPIRVRPDGALQRVSGLDALLPLFRAMAASPGLSWPGGAWFGLHESFRDANPLLKDHPGIAEALNRALDALQVDWARVVSVTSTGPATGRSRGFDLTLSLGGATVVHAPLLLPILD